LFKLNLASLYSPNLILRDLLENILLSCSAHLFLSVLSLTSYFECVVTHPFLSVLSLLLLIGLAAHFCKGPSSTSVKPLFNISAQPQLLEVKGPEDVGIVKVELRYILYSYFIFTFLWLLYSYENWIDLNCIMLPLHLNIKPQISLYISTLGSLHSCTILIFVTILGLTKDYQSQNNIKYK
jgi:hypothetical protein